MLDLIGDAPGNLTSYPRYIGARGAIKSFYYSTRHTQSVAKFILGKHVLTSISSEANINIDSRFLMGCVPKGATHPLLGKSKLVIDDDAAFSITGNSYTNIGPCSVLQIEGDFSMGDSYINSGARIICREEISIGDGCAIAWDVDIFDENGHHLAINGKRSQSREPITIGDNVWIGHHTTIQKGVTIGNGAVVASNSLVTKDVPENTLVAGSPAKPLAEDVTWGEDAKEFPLTSS